MEPRSRWWAPRRGGRLGAGGPGRRPTVSRPDHPPHPPAAMNATPTLSLDLVSDVRQLLSFPFMVHALEAGTIVAVLAAVVGWYMVLRRQSFAGHTLSVMAFPGATGAALAGLPAALGYYLACSGAALAIAGSGRRPAGGDRGRETAAIGTVQATGLAAGF